jgi:hypothetical protein
MPKKPTEGSMSEKHIPPPPNFLVIFLIYDVVILLIRNSPVPREPRTQSQDTESGNLTIIRFVEREGNESNMLNPLQEYVGKVEEMRVDHGDPTSRVEEKVQEYLRDGKRTCDRYKKIISAEDCYSMATIEENKNTLFLIPDIESQGEALEAEGQRYEVVEEGDQTMGGLKDREIPHEIIEEREMEQWHDRETTEREYQVTEVLESRRTPQQQTQEDDSDDLLDDLLDPERDNAANARILDKNTIVIYLRKRVGDSHDVSKPAKGWEWVDLEPMEIPIGDPHNLVGQNMRQYWQLMHLKPHDSNLNKLEFEDCYKVAEEDEDHTLYLMVPSQQTEEEKVAEMLHWPPLSMSPELFHWHKKQNSRRLHASPQAQEETSFERTTLFVAPPNISQYPFPPNNPQLQPPPNIPKLPLPPQQELVESTADFHKDKIGRGSDKPGRPDNRGRFRNIQNRVGMSYKENVIEIRKTPVNMRITQQPSQQAYRERKDRRFKDLKTQPKEMAKQNESSRQGYAELSAAHEKLEGGQGQWREDKEASEDDDEVF